MRRFTGHKPTTGCSLRPELAQASGCQITIELDTLPLSRAFIAERGQDLKTRLFAATGRSGPRSWSRKEKRDLRTRGDAAPDGRRGPRRHVHRGFSRPGAAPRGPQLAGALAIWAIADLAGGSGFLAVYVAGLIAGNSRMRHAAGLKRFQRGITWLSQIVMFPVFHHLTIVRSVDLVNAK